ncbi:hypothetical protein ACGFYP_16130 [Streptomyces sp. NPDC048370]|uniref:hypothetical protein n=1 Tax=Streptomyces sp. NPDC048370 TaxID=3365540 RepID=UPI003717ACDB
MNRRSTQVSGKGVDGLRATADLRAALGAIGITFPSLRFDGPVAAGGDLVHLGGCSAEMAARLAEWIEEHR